MEKRSKKIAQYNIAPEVFSQFKNHPLPHRAKNKILPPAPTSMEEKAARAATRKETKFDLDKWEDVVRANRDASHLSFPLNKPGHHIPTVKAVLQQQKVSGHS